MIFNLPNSNAFTNAEPLNWVLVMGGNNEKLLGDGQSVERATWLAGMGTARSIKNGKSIGISDDCHPNSEPERTTLYSQRLMQADVAGNVTHVATLSAGHPRQFANTIDGKAA